MKQLILPIGLISACVLGASSTTGAAPGAAVWDRDPGIPADTVATTRDTMLLVSLDDGTVVMQRIRSHADVCFKKNSDSSTTCLTQGEPVVDPETNVVIGFEMIEDRIELVAKTD